MFSSPSLALPRLPSTSWEERVSQVSYCQDLCLAQLWIARIIIIFTQQSWASFLRMDVRCFICSEWGLAGCAVWAMYCERHLEARIACTDWYRGEDAFFSQDCSKKTQRNKASPRGTGGSYEQLKQNPDVLIVTAACLIICILCHVKSSLLDVWEPAVATEVAYWEISKAFVETGWHDLLVRSVLNYTVV